MASAEAIERLLDRLIIRARRAESLISEADTFLAGITVEIERVRSMLQSNIDE